MTAAILKFRQWFYVIPLLSLEFAHEKWQLILPLISHEAALAKAKRTAHQIGQVDNLRIVYYKQHIGFVRLVVETDVWNQSSWCIDLDHITHFRGRFESVPKFEKAESIRFKALDEPIFGANPTMFASYLVVEHVK